jgi:hypothetical protein
MNPKYIYVYGNTFYLLNEVPGDGDCISGSREAMHREAFGHVNGCPLRKGASYGQHKEVDGLYQLVNA